MGQRVLPNGRVINFPDGASDAVINHIIATQYTAPEASFEDVSTDADSNLGWGDAFQSMGYGVGNIYANSAERYASKNELPELEAFSGKLGDIFGAGKARHTDTTVGLDEGESGIRILDHLVKEPQDTMRYLVQESGPTVGMMVPSIALSLALKKPIGSVATGAEGLLSGLGLAKTGRVAASAVKAAAMAAPSRTIESYGESGATQHQLQKEGYGRKEAVQIGDKVFAGTMALGALDVLQFIPFMGVLNKIPGANGLISAIPKKALMRMPIAVLKGAVVALSEGHEEIAEEEINLWAKGEGFDWEATLTPKGWKKHPDSFALGMLTGAVTSAAVAGANKTLDVAVGEADGQKRNIFKGSPKSVAAKDVADNVEQSIQKTAPELLELGNLQDDELLDPENGEHAAVLEMDIDELETAALHDIRSGNTDSAVVRGYRQRRNEKEDESLDKIIELEDKLGREPTVKEAVKAGVPKDKAENILSEPVEDQDSKASINLDELGDPAEKADKAFPNLDKTKKASEKVDQETKPSVESGAMRVFDGESEQTVLDDPTERDAATETTHYDSFVEENGKPPKNRNELSSYIKKNEPDFNPQQSRDAAVQEMKNVASEERETPVSKKRTGTFNKEAALRREAPTYMELVTENGAAPTRTELSSRMVLAGKTKSEALRESRSEIEAVADIAGVDLAKRMGSVPRMGDLRRHFLKIGLGNWTQARVQKVLERMKPAMIHVTKGEVRPADANVAEVLPVAQENQAARRETTGETVTRIPNENQADQMETVNKLGKGDTVDLEADTLEVEKKISEEKKADAEERAGQLSAVNDFIDDLEGDKPTPRELIDSRPDIFNLTDEEVGKLKGKAFKAVESEAQELIETAVDARKAKNEKADAEEKAADPKKKKVKEGDGSVLDTEAIDYDAESKANKKRHEAETKDAQARKLEAEKKKAEEEALLAEIEAEEAEKARKAAEEKAAKITPVERVDSPQEGGMDMEVVADVFGDDVNIEETKDGAVITSKDGGPMFGVFKEPIDEIILVGVDNLDPTDQMLADYGTTREKFESERAAGKAGMAGEIKLNADGTRQVVIYLSRGAGTAGSRSVATKATLDHEVFHMALKFGMKNNRQVAQILGRYLDQAMRTRGVSGLNIKDLVNNPEQEVGEGLTGLDILSTVEELAANDYGTWRNQKGLLGAISKWINKLYSAYKGAPTRATDFADLREGKFDTETDFVYEPGQITNKASLKSDDGVGLSYGANLAQLETFVRSVYGDKLINDSKDKMDKETDEIWFSSYGVFAQTPKETRQLNNAKRQRFMDWLALSANNRWGTSFKSHPDGLVSAKDNLDLANARKSVEEHAARRGSKAQLFIDTGEVNTDVLDFEFKLGEREVAETSKIRLTPKDKAAAHSFVAKKYNTSMKKVSELLKGSKEARAEYTKVVKVIKAYKARYPKSAGWAAFDVEELAESKKDALHVSALHKQKYAFNNPTRKALPPSGKYRNQQEAIAVKRIAKLLVKDVEKILKRTDGEAQVIKNNLSWYSDMERNLRSTFGGFGEVFADLLGAFSPQTAVRLNWRYAIQGLEDLTAGKYDRELEALDAWINDGGDLTKFPDIDKITSRSGKLFGINSVKGAQAMLGVWRAVKKGDAPKAKNFAKNLIGRSNSATIDVWAARRLESHMKKKILPPLAESGVDGKLKKNLEPGSLFGVGDRAFQMAIDMLHEQGHTEIKTPKDLQAMIWFLEKENWAKKGWTTEDGSGGSFESEYRKAGLRRVTVGLSPYQTNEEYEADPAAVQKRADAIIKSIGEMEKKDGVIAVRANATEGGYLMFDDKGTAEVQKEPSIDIELVVDDTFDMDGFVRKVARLGEYANQDSVIVTQRAMSGEAFAEGRPTIDIYFDEGMSFADAEAQVISKLPAQMSGYTAITESREAMAKAPVKSIGQEARGDRDYFGVRVTWIPEFGPDKIAASVYDAREKVERVLLEFAKDIHKKDFIHSISIGRNDAIIMQRGNYDQYYTRTAKSDRVSEADDQQTRGSRFGLKLPQGLAGAVAGAGAESESADVGDGSGTQEKASIWIDDARQGDSEKITGYHFARNRPEDDEGLKREYAGTGSAGQEKARFRYLKDGKINPSSAAVHVYLPGATPEASVVSPSKYLLEFTTAFDLLSTTGKQIEEIKALPEVNTKDGYKIFGAELVDSVLEYIENETKYDGIVDLDSGRVQVLRDITDSEIEYMRELSAEDKGPYISKDGNSLPGSNVVRGDFGNKASIEINHDAKTTEEIYDLAEDVYDFISGELTPYDKRTMDAFPDFALDNNRPANIVYEELISEYGIPSEHAEIIKQYIQNIYNGNKQKLSEVVIPAAEAAVTKTASDNKASINVLEEAWLKDSSAQGAYLKNPDGSFSESDSGAMLSAKIPYRLGGQLLSEEQEAINNGLEAIGYDDRIEVSDTPVPTENILAELEDIVLGQNDLDAVLGFAGWDSRETTNGFRVFSEEQVREQPIEEVIDAHRKASLEFADEGLNEEEWGLLKKWFTGRDRGSFLGTLEAMKIQKKIKILAGEKSKIMVVPKMIGLGTALDDSGRYFGTKAKDMDQALHIAIDLRADEARNDIATYYSQLTQEQKRIVDLAKKVELDPALRSLADEIEAVNKKYGEENVEANLISTVRDHYVSRAWNDQYGKQLTPNRALQRKFSSVLEGWAKGYTLRIIGASNNTAAMIEEMRHTARNRDLIQEGMRTQAPVDGAKDTFLITHAVPRENSTDYTKIDNPIFSYHKPVSVVQGTNVSQKQYGNRIVTTKYVAVNAARTDKKVNSRVLETRAEVEAWIAKKKNPGQYRIEERVTLWERSTLYAHKSLAKRINAVTAPGFARKSSAWNTLLKINSIVKATLLMTSFFHHLAFMRSFYIGTGGANPLAPITDRLDAADGSSFSKMSMKKAYQEGLKMIEQMNPELMALVDQGLTLGSIQDWDNAVFADRSKFVELLHSNNVTGKAADYLSELRERQSSFLFKRLGASLKAQSALLEYKHQLASADGSLSDEEIQRRVAQLINEDFGGLHFDRMGVAKTTREWGRLLLLASDWTSSNFLTLKRMVFAGRGLRRGSKSHRQMYQKFWLGIALRGVLFTTAMNLLMALGDDDDEDRWEAMAKEPLRSMHWAALDVTPIYKGYKAMMNGEPDGRRRYFSIIGHFADPMKWFMRPAESVKHKSSPAMRMLNEFASGSDWKGDPFTTMPEFFGMDNAGYYKTSGYGHLAGEAKGGKYGLQLTKPSYSGGSGSLKTGQIPSYLFSQAISAMPVQTKEIYGAATGEIDWFDAIARSMGSHVRRGSGTEYGMIVKELEQFKNELDNAKYEDKTKYASMRRDNIVMIRAMKAAEKSESVIRALNSKLLLAEKKGDEEMAQTLKDRITKAEEMFVAKYKKVS